MNVSHQIYPGSMQKEKRGVAGRMSRIVWEEVLWSVGRSIGKGGRWMLLLTVDIEKSSS